MIKKVKYIVCSLMITFTGVLLGLSMKVEAMENKDSNIEAIYDIADAISQKDWNRFTGYFSTSEQEYYNYYFDSQETVGVKQVKRAVVDEIIPVEPVVAQDSLLTKEYPILNNAEDIKCYILALSCDVSIENEFFFNGINYFLVVFAQEDGEMKIIQFNRPTMKLLENSLIQTMDANGSNSDERLSGINVIQQAENGVCVNANNEILSNNFTTIYASNEGEDDSIEVYAGGTGNYPNLNHYAIYSYPEEIKVKMNKTGNGNIKTVAMEEYIKCTLPNEWMGSWNADALKAGAYCVKMVGWYRTLKPVSSTGGYHVTQGTQNYIESSNYSTTDSAVNAIRCSGMANSTCNLFFPEYARGVKGDKGVKASGKLKQYGTLALAQDGYGYRNILNYYYSGSSYSDGDVVLFSYEE